MVLIRPDGTGEYGYCIECVAAIPSVGIVGVQDKLVDTAIALKHAIDNGDDPIKYLDLVEHYVHIIYSENDLANQETKTQNKETEQ